MVCTYARTYVTMVTVGRVDSGYPRDVHVARNLDRCIVLKHSIVTQSAANSETADATK